MKLRRHKWKKVKEDIVSIPFGGNGLKFNIIPKGVCINCGLKKGSHGMYYYTSELVYYNDDRVLSRNTLPFSCIGNNDFFIKEDEFKV